jgi:PAS domain S-box-containing protein
MTARLIPEAVETQPAAGGLSRLFRVHFDNLPGPAYMWRRSGDDFLLIAYNRAAADLQFSRIAKFIGMGARALQTGSGHDLCADLECCARTGNVIRRTVEHRYLGTGTARRLAVSLVPVSADIVVLHTDDVTEREQTESALRASEQKYRSIVDTAHEGIVAVNHEGIATYANRRMAAMLGYAADDLVGRSVFDFIDESMHAEARRARARHVAGVKELLLRHESGAGVWVSVASSPQTDEHGNVVGAIHMVSDISERKRTEQALRRSEAHFRALLQANPDMIVRVTRDGRYVDVHVPEGRTEDFLPRPSREFIGRNVRELFDAEFACEHERHRLKALETGDVQLWEYVRRVNGSDRHVEARFVRSGADEVVITLRDISRRVELENEVISSTERERARIGHDLHDGLAQLLIGVKLLLEAHADKLAAEGSAHTADARRAAALMTDAVTQTGELAQGLSPIRRGSRFGEALRQLAAESQILLGTVCSVVVRDPPTDLDEDTASHLYRIAQEAITNSIKHGKATHVELKCERQRHRYLLSVADNGTGIADRGDVGGMGMHTMAYRARSIGGELSVACRADGGTVVKCYFPRPAARRSSRIA